MKTKPTRVDTETRANAALVPPIPPNESFYERLERTGDSLVEAPQPWKPKASVDKDQRSPF